MLLPIIVANYNALTFEFYPQTGDYLISKIADGHFQDIEAAEIKTAASALGILGGWQPAPGDCFRRWVHIKPA